MRHFGTGLAVGVLLGGLIGLLVAPQRGTATRERVKEVAHEVGDKVTHTLKIRKAEPEYSDYIRQSI